MTGPAAVEIVLSERERGELEARVRRRKIARADAMRAEIVLLAADGLNNCAIADEIGVSRMTVLTWRKRFAAQRLMVSMTSRVVARRARSATTRSPMW